MVGQFYEQAKMQWSKRLLPTNTLQDLEAVIQMGMEAGLTSTLERLDDYANLKKKIVMNKSTFDFTVDKETCTVYVKKEFAAKPDLVWDAYTKPEWLDQWWAPKPWLSKTKSMEFKVGGRRLYAMLGPEGEEHWALADFTSISPKTNFKFSDAFCDAAGNINNEMPRSDWDLDFVDQGNTTLVNMVVKHKTLADLEKIISFGFKEGFTIALNGLDELFTNVKN